MSKSRSTGSSRDVSVSKEIKKQEIMSWDEVPPSSMNWCIRMRLLRPLTQRYEFRAHGHSAGDFHTYDGFERLEFASVRNGEPQEQLFQRILLADIFDSSLRADRSSACQNQDRMCRIQSSL